MDTCFRDVIYNCANTRKENGTWITDEMIEAYCKLYELGFAHSVDAWHENKLVGGLYGIIIGKCFFDEFLVLVKRWISISPLKLSFK